MSDNNTETIFSRSRTVFFNYWIIFNVFLFVVIILRYFIKGGSSLFSFVILINLVLILSRLSTYRLKTLIINKEKSTVSVELDKFLFKKKIILCSLDQTVAGFYREHRARGMMGNVFKIHCKDQLLAEAVPGLSGWSEDNFNAFIHEIKAPS